MRAFREFVEQSIDSGDLTGVEDLLADDIVFRSPVAFKPYEGRAIVAAILRGVGRVLEDFHYVWSAEEENRSALMFQARIGEVAVNGCDFLTVGDDGRITEFAVMVRPLSAANALAEAMGAQFPRIEAEALAALEGRS